MSAKKLDSRGILDRRGKKLVSAIKQDMVDKGLVDTGAALRGVKYKTDGKSLTVSWLARTKYLVLGRGPGGRPPFDLIRDWVVRKLDPPADKVWPVATAICKKIETEGTAIYRGKKKGLSIEIIRDGAVKAITSGITTDYKQRISKKIKKSWR